MEMQVGKQYFIFKKQFKIRPLMDGNSYTFVSFPTMSWFKIRPLMDGNFSSLKVL